MAFYMRRLDVGQIISATLSKREDVFPLPFLTSMDAKPANMAYALRGIETFNGFAC